MAWNGKVGQRKIEKSQVLTKKVNNGYCKRNFIWMVCAMFYVD